MIKISRWDTRVFLLFSLEKEERQVKEKRKKREREKSRRDLDSRSPFSLSLLPLTICSTLFIPFCVLKAYGTAEKRKESSVFQSERWFWVLDFFLKERQKMNAEREELSSPRFLLLSHTIFFQSCSVREVNDCVGEEKRSFFKKTRRSWSWKFFSGKAKAENNNNREREKKSPPLFLLLSHTIRFFFLEKKILLLLLLLFLFSSSSSFHLVFSRSPSRQALATNFRRSNNVSNRKTTRVEASTFEKKSF